MIDKIPQEEAEKICEKEGHDWRAYGRFIKGKQLPFNRVCLRCDKETFSPKEL
jgi:hypothetical protein